MGRRRGFLSAFLRPTKGFAFEGMGGLLRGSFVVKGPKGSGVNKRDEKMTRNRPEDD